MTYAARPSIETGLKRKTKGKRGHGAVFPAERTITFADILARGGKGRNSDDPNLLLGAGQSSGQSVLADRGARLRAGQGTGPSGVKIRPRWLLGVGQN